MKMEMYLFIMMTLSGLGYLFSLFFEGEIL